jgi:hypothetical protein
MPARRLHTPAAVAAVAAVMIGDLCSPATEPTLLLHPRARAGPSAYIYIFPLGYFSQRTTLFDAPGGESSRSFTLLGESGFAPNQLDELWLAAYSSAEGRLQWATRVSGATPGGFFFDFGNFNKPGVALTTRGDLALAAGPFLTTDNGLVLFDSARLGEQPVPSGLPPVVASTPAGASNILIARYTTEGKARWGATVGPGEPTFNAVTTVSKRQVHACSLLLPLEVRAPAAAAACPWPRLP